LNRRAKPALTIFNLLGQTIRQFDMGELSAGTWMISWDGTDEQGAEVASGVYFYRLQTEEFAVARKMLLLK